MDPQLLISEGAIDLDPSKASHHDGDTYSDGVTTYRERFCDTAEVAGSYGNKCWGDQYGIGEFAGINFGKRGKEYAIAAFQNAQHVQIIKGNIVDGRKLVATIIDGQSLPCLLIREGLAWENVSHYYEGQLDNLPPLPDQAYKAAKLAEQHFQKPWEYKNDAEPCQE